MHLSWLYKYILFFFFKAIVNNITPSSCIPWFYSLKKIIFVSQRRLLFLCLNNVLAVWVHETIFEDDFRLFRYSTDLHQCDKTWIIEMNVASFALNASSLCLQTSSGMTVNIKTHLMCKSVSSLFQKHIYRFLVINLHALKGRVSLRTVRVDNTSKWFI